jgi:hypothetical protein
MLKTIIRIDFAIRFDVHFVMEINQHVHRTFNFCSVDRQHFSFISCHSLLQMPISMLNRQRQQINGFSSIPTTVLISSLHPAIHFVAIAKIQVNFSAGRLDFRCASIDILDDLLNDNTNMSTVSLSSMCRYLSFVVERTFVGFPFSHDRQCCTAKQHVTFTSRLARQCALLIRFLCTHR